MRDGGLPIATGENLHAFYEFKQMIASGGVTFPEAVLPIWSSMSVPAPGFLPANSGRALPDAMRIVGIEPSPSMRAQAVTETADHAGLAFGDGVAEHLPFVGDAARAVVAATAAHWFDRPAFYAKARRILVPGGVIAIVEYVRDQAGSPIAAALIEFTDDNC